MTLLDERPVADEPRPASAPRGTSSTGRWRLAAKLARREVRRRPWRTVLVVLLVAVPVAALVAADIAYRTDRLRTTGEFGTASVRAQLWGPPASFGDDDIEAVLPPGTPYSWWYETGLPLRDAASPDGVHFTTVMSIDPAAPINEGIVRVVEGRNAAAGDEITLTASTADDFGVGVGDRLALVRPDQSFTVVGIVATAGQGSAMIAPGFDWSAVRQGARFATVLAGDEADPADAIDSTWVWKVAAAVNGTASVDQRTSEDRSDPIALFFGWLGGTIAMGVLGIVVASAFAVSGRRQLVTIGQLSATGADASVLRRFLALQGTFSGAAGAVVGVAGGAVLVAALDEHIRRDGRLAIHVIDIAIVAITAVVVATGAALVPARSLATTSVLTALGGRRPVAPVRPRQVRIGAMLTGGGLVVLVLCFAAGNSGSGSEAIVLIAALAAIALLAGICCLAPAIVSAIARAGRGAGGSLRLAIRDLERHRARSGALLAAVIVVGAGVIAIGSAVDREAVRRANWSSSWSPAEIIVNSYRYSDDPNVEPPPAPRVDDVAPTMRASVEAVVGPVQWGERATVVFASGSESLLFATILDPVLLRIDGFDEDEIAAATAADLVQVSRSWTSPLSDAQLETIATELGIAVDDLVVATISADVDDRGGSSGYVYVDSVSYLYVSRSAVDRAGLPVETDPALYGLADHAVTRAEYDQLGTLGTGYDDAYYFTVVDPADSVQVSVQATYPERDVLMIARWSVIGGALLLVSLVVALGLALWAAEGREERNTLVTIGAPPSTVAAMAGWKALLLAGVGGIVAVPLGYGTLRLCFLAASDWTPFPWLTALGVVVIIPLVVALGSVVISSIAQRTRPVRAVLASTD
jgi:putative ABC transport system permease protein